MRFVSLRSLVALAFVWLAFPVATFADVVVNIQTSPASPVSGNYTVSGNCTWGAGDTTPVNIKAYVQVYNDASKQWNLYQTVNNVSFSLGSSPGTWSFSTSAPTVAGQYRWQVVACDANGVVLNMPNAYLNFTVN